MRAHPLLLACPRHHVLLVGSVCGRKQDEWAAPEQRALRPGVCRQCGTIAFGCSSGRPCSASPTQQWIASQVGKLIAAESGGEEFIQEAVFCGLEAAIKSGWTNMATAERALGLHRTAFSAIFHFHQRLDFRLLLVICSHIQAEPISVLRGIVKTDNLDVQPLQIDWRSKRQPKNRREIERALPRILASTPDITFSAVADKLGVAGERFTRLFPELAREFRERQELQTRRRRFQRLLAFGRTLRVLKAQLEAEGHAFSHQRVFALTGVMIRQANPEERLFNWVRRRPTV
jgi:hypothetical protein